MSSIILIRGDMIAFSNRPGFTDANEGEVICPDISATMMESGWFIPVVAHGSQVGYMLDHDQLYKPHDQPSPHGGNIGVKGVMAMVGPDFDVTYHRVEVNTKRNVIMTPLYTGKTGFAIITPWDHLADVMAMCVLLTKTIEQTIDMYHRHTQGDKSSFEFWDKKQTWDHMKKYHVPYVKRILERHEPAKV